MVDKELTTIHIEQSIDLQDFAYEFSLKASEEDYKRFITLLDKEIGVVDYTEVLFKTGLNRMISLIEEHQEEYAGTKWEMVLAMKGLLEK